jgi:hypothetical protein
MPVNGTVELLFAIASWFEKHWGCLHALRHVLLPLRSMPQPAAAHHWGELAVFKRQHCQRVKV